MIRIETHSVVRFQCDTISEIKEVIGKFRQNQSWKVFGYNHENTLSTSWDTLLTEKTIDDFYIEAEDKKCNDFTVTLFS
jgi:hypothetical protein